jgi:hypothetical protein
MTRTDEWMKNYLRKKWNLPDNVEMDLSGLKISYVEKKEDTALAVDTSLLTYNDTITYRSGFTAQPGIADQDVAQGPYTGKIVDLGRLMVGVRADGMDGQEPLYYVFRVDILSVEHVTRASS